MNDRKLIKKSYNKLGGLIIAQIIILILDCTIIYRCIMAIITFDTSVYRPLGVFDFIILGLIPFLFTLLDNLRALFKQKIYLTIDDQGIDNHSYGIKYPLIPWRAIKEIKLKTQFAESSRIILIYLHDPDSYLNNESFNKEQRDKAEVFYEKEGTPVVIAASRLAIQDKKLRNLLQKRLSQYQSLS